MAINKVIYGEDVLLDLTSDTVSADTLVKGVTAHDASGETIVGTAQISPFRIHDGFAVLTDSNVGTATTIEYQDSFIAIKEVN